MIDPIVETYVWIGLVVFLIMVVVLGYIGSRQTKILADFTIGGARLGPYILGAAYAATFFSAATFVGYVGWAYAWGYSALWVFLAIFVASTAGALTFARKARTENIKQRSQSLPDWLGDYYNSDFLRAGVAVILMFNLFYVAAQLTAGAYVFNLLLGWDYLIALAFITIVVVGYVVAGGTFADVYTDAVQGVLMVIMGVICFVTGMSYLGEGGFNQLTETLRGIDPKLVAVFNPDAVHFYALSAVVGVFIIEYAFAAQPQLFNKILALKKPGDLWKMIMTYFVFAFCMMLVIFVGFFAHEIGLVVDVPDHTIYLFSGTVFHPIVSALLVMVIMSAALSTTDGLIVVLATTFSNDFYRKTLVKRGIIKVKSQEHMDRTALKISRVATVFIGIIAALLVIDPPAFIGTLIWYGISGVASGTLGPLIIGMFMKDKVTAKGAIITMFLGVISYGIIFMMGFERSVMAAGAWAVCISTAFFLIYTLLFPKKEGVS